MENNILTLILIALICHIIFDFIFQNQRIISGRFPKTSINKSSLKNVAFINCLHSILHTIGIIILIIIVEFFIGFELQESIFKILAIGILHFAIDFAKSILVMMDAKNNNIWLFVFDQTLHFISIILIFTIGSFNDINEYLYHIVTDYPNSLLPHDKVLFGILILLTATFASGYFAKILLGRVRNKNKDQEEGGAVNGGFIIGVLERLFIIIGIVIKEPSVIVLVLTLKSIARYNKFKDDDFVEYFIIGTLFSLIIGILSGVLIAKMISFTIS